MNLRNGCLTSLAVALALACSLSITACAQRESTTAEDYAANQSTEEAAQTEEQTVAEETTETTEAVGTEATKVEEDTSSSDTPEVDATEDGQVDEEKDEEKAPLLNTQMLMSSITTSDKLISGDIEMDQEEIASFPEYDGDEYETLDAPSPTEIDDIATAKASSDGTLWYTSGFAIIAPTHWKATLGSDEIDFTGTQYDLTAVMQSWNKAGWGISSSDAADYFVASLCEDGFYNVRFLDRGLIAIGGNPRGSYAQLLADFDWKGTTETFVIDVNYIEGRTKMNYLGFMTPASAYSAAWQDIDAVWASMGFVNGEEF